MKDLKLFNIIPDVIYDCANVYIFPKGFLSVNRLVTKKKLFFNYCLPKLCKSSQYYGEFCYIRPLVLTGFIEADGSFQIRASLLKTKLLRLGLSCEISQSRITKYGFSTLNLMKLISEFLNVKLEFTRENRKYPQYRIRTNSAIKNIKIRDYLLLYPLQSSKYLDFKD